MEEIQRPRNTNIYFSCCGGTITTDKRQAYDNHFNNNSNPTNHQMKKDINVCRNIFNATNWQYLLAFLLSSELFLGANSMITKSRYATIPSAEAVEQPFSTTTQNTFSVRNNSTQSISAVEYSPPTIIEDAIQTSYASPTSASSIALRSILTSSASDVLVKDFSMSTSSSSSFSIAELPIASFEGLTSIKSRENHDQLYMAAYQQNSDSPNYSMTSRNITVQLGNHAYLPCNIQRTLNKPISWLRLRDGHILSVDQATFISDQRFQSLFQVKSDSTWSLQIKYVHKSDEGWYECQMPTEPKMSAKIYLAVVVPHTELIGERNRFVKTGSKVALHCIVRDTLDPPAYIIWFRDKTQITNGNEMGWYTEIDRAIFGNTDSSRNTIGSLIIPHVRKQDSDTYTCEPSNSESVSVDLHVLSGEYSASAIMSEAGSHRLNISIFTCHIFCLLLLNAIGKT